MSRRRVVPLAFLSVLLLGAPGAHAQEVPSEAELYQRVVALDLDTQGDQAIPLLMELVRQYPEGPHFDWAMYQIGEYWFAHNSAFKALGAYKRVSVLAGSPYQLVASYKLAWCFYNVGEYEKALSTLEAIVAPGVASYTIPDQRNVAEAALQDLVRFYADAGALDRAEQTFRAQGRLDLLTQALLRLAKGYEDVGKFEAAIQTWQRLVDLNPTAPEIARYQAEIARIRAKMN